ncbi:hypothetical protein TCAL_03904 [Tigriopus californicus]|uniref:C2 domain-containing protein n=1 Tax=Tigriopus californicus TaxID=6832 RepID=A0A553NF49_TIGCA|nr:hypothetical protein TCAL_03904 [Tigriopus californicus]
MRTTGLKIKIACENLASICDTSCVVYENENLKWHKVGSTEVCLKSANPSWKKTIDIDYHFGKREMLKFKVCNQDKEIVGGMEVTLATLVASPGKVFKSKMTLGPSKNGRFIITTKECPSQKRHGQPSFVDYIQNGTALNFAVAIDFTSSNGNPRSSSSLHYRGNPKGKNAYTEAIRALGPILEDYDADNLFPACGFGAKVPPSDEVSHGFFLNQSRHNPDCRGVEGILKAYATSLEKVKLSGPTHFAPVINYTAKVARQHKDGRKYYVLLIITDGAITDLEQTKSAIIKASDLPMSIIIIGVGKANFSSMVALDSDDRLLRYHGREAKRDIVQFVEINKFAKDNGTWKKKALAMEVLSEVPTQVVQWMTENGINPL